MYEGESLNIKQQKGIYLLDCTLRDGGNCLEDVWDLQNKKITFSKEFQKLFLQYMSNTNIDVIEYGVVDNNNTDRSGFSYFDDIESASRMIPAHKKLNQIYAVGSNIPQTDEDYFGNYGVGIFEGVRVYLRYSELNKSLEYCKKLARNGYKVFMQNALTMRYSDYDLDCVINAANEMGAFAVYFVDSNGYMNCYDVERFAERFERGLDSSIKIGFHAHNHLNLAYANTCCFIDTVQQHDIIVDSCIAGMGRGGGNLQTEIIAGYLNKNYGKSYNIDAILDAYELIEKKYIPNNIWGYSAENVLSAIHETTNKYVVIMRRKYNLSYKQIHYILEEMPKEMKYRYTEENLKYLLKKVI